MRSELTHINDSWNPFCLCVLHARKKEDVEAGGSVKPFDVEGIKLIEPLIL